jgi:hypothetical protein
MKEISGNDFFRIIEENRKTMVEVLKRSGIDSFFVGDAISIEKGLAFGDKLTFYPNHNSLIVPSEDKLSQAREIARSYEEIRGRELNLVKLYE